LWEKVACRGDVLHLAVEYVELELREQVMKVEAMERFRDN